MKTSMRYFAWVSALCLFPLCSSCINTLQDEDEEHSSVNVQCKNLTFKVKPYDQTPITKATTISDFKVIDAALYTYDNTNGYKIYQKITQNEGDEGFKTLNFSSVNYGNYTLVVCGQTKTDHAVMDNPLAITYPDNQVPQMQYYMQNLTVSESSTPGGRITTALGIARFALTIKEVIPETVSTIRLTVEGTSTQFNAKEGLGVAPATQRVISLNVISKRGLSSVTLGCYLWLLNEEETAETSTVKITADALDESDQVVCTHIFDKVPLKRGYSTNYSGDFFDPAVGSIGLDRQTNYMGNIDVEF